MHTFLTEVRQTLVPTRSGRDGPLPPLLVAMTLVTGLVDAFSYLVLGHVFVANMTGNVVFLGFAVTGAPGFSIGASVTALVSFCVGALVGGQAAKRYRTHRGRLLSTATTIETVLLAASVVLASLGGTPVTPGLRYALIFVLATAMGVQNAAARQVAVPDLTTTVLTLTITGIVADSTIVGGKGYEIRTPPHRDRRHVRRGPGGGGVRPARAHRRGPGDRPRGAGRGGRHHLRDGEVRIRLGQGSKLIRSGFARCTQR